MNSTPIDISTDSSRAVARPASQCQRCQSGSVIGDLQGAAAQYGRPSVLLLHQMAVEAVSAQSPIYSQSRPGPTVQSGYQLGTASG